jgi:hypothetical protein
MGGPQLTHFQISNIISCSDDLSPLSRHSHPLPSIAPSMAVYLFRASLNTIYKSDGNTAIPQTGLLHAHHPLLHAGKIAGPTDSGGPHVVLA